MSMLGHLPEPPVVGQLFDNFQILKELIEDWSIKEKFSFKIANKDPTRVIYTCTMERCAQRVRASQDEMLFLLLLLSLKSHFKMRQ